MEYVRIDTTQNVAIDYEIASLGERILAYLVDVLIFVALTYGLFYVLKLSPTDLIFLEAYWWKIAIAMAVYFIYFDGSESNATLGKQIMNIRLLNEAQRDADFTDSVKHFFLSLLLFFGYIFLLSNEKRQTLADKICKVIVVKV